jgi:hypothetical protein
MSNHAFCKFQQELHINKAPSEANSFERYKHFNVEELQSSTVLSFCHTGVAQTFAR